MPEKTLHVISHTHWDREWYNTLQQFRMKLVDLIDHLLDILENDPNFRYFNLDGQTIVLEDYLQIRPEKRQILENYIREGRILVGPWYQLNDEYLVSGESTIRSLLIGHRIAKEFGAVMKLGYLPDQFGNISQMPQIFNGFGIDCAIFGRGLQLVDDRKMEFWWESPDGSKVLASLMAFWYNNAMRFPADTDDALRFTKEIQERMEKVSHVNALLLMNGVDHMEAQPNLSGILARVNEKLQGAKLVHSTLPQYINDVKQSVKANSIKLDTVNGELREDRWSNILAGTLSSRIYIKQANEDSQTLLEKYAEPMASYAYMLGNKYPQGFLTFAWKLLMQNHPHDSICGCSIDQVHREMMPRFAQVRQVAKDLTNRAMKSIADRISTESESIVVFNPLNWPRTDKVHAVIDFQMGEPTRGEPTIDRSKDVHSISITDDEGNNVLFVIISNKVIGKQLLDPQELPFVAMTRRFEIEFVAEDVPSCGYRTYGVVPNGESQEADTSITAETYWDNALTNEYLRLSIQSGSVSIERLGTCEEFPLGEVYSNINMLEDTGDVGDEYLHKKPTSNLTVVGFNGNTQVSLVDQNPVSATLKVSGKLQLPACALRDGSARVEETVDCPVTSYLTVTRGVPRVDITTIVDNHAKDHRLRVLFPSGIDADVSHAEGQFDVLERPIKARAEWPGASHFYPQQRWVDISDGERGLCLINKGLPEFEVYDDDARTLALTLLRCVGQISGGSDAPGAELTPEAQCIGEYTFNYAVYPHEGDWQDAEVWRQAHQHNVPMLAFQTGAHEGDLPTEYSFIETSHSELVVSAAKKAEDSDLLVVRVHNLTDKPLEDAWVRVNGAISAKQLNMNEEIIGDVDFADSTVSLTVGSKKIITLGFGLE